MKTNPLILPDVTTPRICTRRKGRVVAGLSLHPDGKQAIRLVAESNGLSFSEAARQLIDLGLKSLNHDTGTETT